MAWFTWKGRPLTLRRVTGYLARRLRNWAHSPRPRPDEQPFDWQRLAEALGALEQELQEVHALLREMTVPGVAAPPPPQRPPA